MNLWMEQLNRVIISILGIEHSSAERLIIAFLGIIAFFLVIKLLTRIKGVYNTSGLRRILGSIVILCTLLFGAVFADMYVIPYVTNFAIRNIVYFIVPLLSLTLIGAPLLMAIFRKGYGDSLVTALSAVAGFALMVCIAGFIMNSMQGASTGFVHLKDRTRTMDQFINH